MGTGPFRLGEWVRGSRVVLEANPGYRSIAFPGSDDPALQPMIQAMKGRKLPALSRIEISIIEEQVPELLAFDQGSLDYIALTGSILSRLLDNGKLKPELRAARHPPLPLHRSRRSSTRISTRTTRSSAAMRRSGSRCGARSRWASTATNSSRCSTAARACPRTSCCRRGRAATTRSCRRNRRTIPPPRARSSTASATRIATATASGKRPTASRSCSCRARCRTA